MYCSKRKLFGCLSLSVLLSIGFCAELGAVKKKVEVVENNETPEKKPGGIKKKRKKRNQALQPAQLSNGKGCIILQRFAQKLESDLKYYTMPLKDILSMVFREDLDQIVNNIGAKRAFSEIGLPVWSDITKMSLPELKDCIRGAYKKFGGDPNELYMPSGMLSSLIPPAPHTEGLPQQNEDDKKGEDGVASLTTCIIENTNDLGNVEPTPYFDIQIDLQSKTPWLPMEDKELERFTNNKYQEINQLFGLYDQHAHN